MESDVLPSSLTKIHCSWLELRRVTFTSAPPRWHLSSWWHLRPMSHRSTRLSGMASTTIFSSPVLPNTRFCSGTSKEHGKKAFVSDCLCFRDIPSPILSYSVGGQICDVAWSCHSSTLFGIITNDGAVFIYDLFINKYAPVCKQVIRSCHHWYSSRHSRELSAAMMVFLTIWYSMPRNLCLWLVTAG